MSKLNVTYTADSLDDLADGLAERAAEKRLEAETTSTATQKRELIGFADGVEWAVTVIRNCKIPGVM